MCYCDGWEVAQVEGVIAGVATSVIGADRALCLPPAECQRACEAQPDICWGFDVHHTRSVCYLHTVECEAGMVRDEDYIARAQGGASCMDDGDFVGIGELVVTDRVHVGSNWVLGPGEEGSIEVPAPAGFTLPAVTTVSSRRLSTCPPTPLTVNERGTSQDRILITDCESPCGTAEPTSSLVLPQLSPSVADFAAWAPVEANITAADTPQVQEEEYVFSTNTRAYCPYANFEVADRAASDPEIFDHQCYRKCHPQEPCLGAECFCDGFLRDRDDEDTNAICGDRTLCEQLCAGSPDCVSIDMHRNMPRCFLNVEDQCASTDTIVFQQAAIRETYNLLVKQLVTPVLTGTGGVRARATFETSPTAQDMGYSYERLLRFYPVQFKDSGSFKVCFCDSTVTSSCATSGDFLFEIGTIQVSGVSCLLTNPTLRKGQCIQQYHGGLRCFDQGRVVVRHDPPVPAQGARLAPGGGRSVARAMFCQYGPRQETMLDPLCRAMEAPTPGPAQAPEVGGTERREL